MSMPSQQYEYSPLRDSPVEYEYEYPPGLYSYSPLDINGLDYESYLNDINNAFYPAAELWSPPAPSGRDDCEAHDSRPSHAGRIPSPFTKWQSDSSSPLLSTSQSTPDLIPSEINTISPVEKSTLIFQSEPVFRDLSSPETNSICTAILTPAQETTPSLQIVQYDHLDQLTSPTSRSQRNTRVKKSRVKGKRSRALGSRRDALQTDTSPKTIVKTDTSGKFAGVERVFGLSQNVRAALSTELQIKTSVTRRLGACARCRRNKMRCDLPEDLYSPCGRCIKLSENLLQQPCIRVSIIGLSLHRKGSTLNDDLYNWTSRKSQLKMSRLHGSPRPENSHAIYITQDLGAEFIVSVSLFDPEPGDTTGYKWEDPEGNIQVMEMPPYSISNMEEALINIQEYSHRSRSLYIEALLADANPIVRSTFQVALSSAAFSQSSLVSDALNFWVATRLTELPWRISCGASMLGLDASYQPGNPWNGTIPVTPIMDTQLDDLIIRAQLVPLSDRFLKELKRKIDQKRRDNWLDIYLSIFIMMSNVEWILKDVVEYTKRHGMKSGSRGGTSLTQGYMHACKTMISYFHFACNGAVPFSLTWPEPRQRFDKLTRDQREYIKTIQQEISRQERKLSEWKYTSMYTSEMYWCNQLLCKDWRGDIPHVGEVDDFTEEDFLTS